MAISLKEYVIGQCSFGKFPSETYSNDKQEKIYDFMQVPLGLERVGI